MQSLIRNLWFGGALILALAVGVYGESFTPLFIGAATFGGLSDEAIAAVSAAPALRFASALAVGGLTAFLFGFLGLAIADGVAAELSHQKLLTLRRASRGEETPGRDAFIDAFASSVELTQAARGHASQLFVGAAYKRPSGAMVTVFRASTPAQASFPRDALVEHPLFLWFYRALAFAVAGGGLIGFTGALGTAEAAVVGGPGLVALAVGLSAALFMLVVERLAVGYRHAQHTQICAAIDAIYRPGAETHRFEEVAAAAHQSAEAMARAAEASASDIRATMEAATRGLAEHFSASADRIARAVAEAAKSSRADIGQAVGDSLASPIADIQKALEALTADQGERVHLLMKDALSAFLAEMKTNFGGQFADVRTALDASITSIGRMEDVYSQSIAALSQQTVEGAATMAREFKVALHAMRNGDAKYRKERNNGLHEIATLLSEELRGHSERIQAALDTAIKTAETLTVQSVQKTASDLGHTAETFAKLHGSVEGMVAMISPILRQTIANQESILAALESESSNSKVLGRAASEMSAAAEASRSTVDRFLALAEALRETSAAIGGVAANRNEPAEPEVRQAAQAVGAEPARRGHSFSQAIRQLRESSKAAPNTLPKLD